MSLAKLRDQMMEHFNKSELRDICFDLSINHENIAGDTLNDMARELVLYCHRLRRIEELVKYCEKLRPDASWHLIQADGLVDTQHLLENNSPHDDKVSRDSIETYVQKWIDYCVTWSQSEDMKDALERNWLDIEKTINLLYFRTGLPLSLQDKVAASQLVRIIEAIHPHIFGYDFNSEQVKLLIFGYESARSLNDLRNAGKCAFSIANYYTVKTNETSLAERWVYRLEDLIPQVVTEEKYIPYLKGYIFEMLGHISLRNSNFIEAQKRYNMAQTKYEEIGSRSARSCQ